MRAELASVLFVAITISTCVASRGAQSEPKDKQSVTRDAKVGDAQIAMTEHFQLEVILNSDRTWQFENQAYNYSRREVRPSKTLIPEGYVGWITIQYGVKGAPPLRIEDGYIVIAFSGPS